MYGGPLNINCRRVVKFLQKVISAKQNASREMILARDSVTFHNHSKYFVMVMDEENSVGCMKVTPHYY